MIPIPAGVRVYLAMGPTDMRKGFDGLALLVQEVLKKDPYSGHLFIFRGRRSDRLKLLYCGFRFDPATCSDLTPATHSNPVPATCSDRIPATP